MCTRLSMVAFVKKPTCPSTRFENYHVSVNLATRVSCVIYFGVTRNMPPDVVPPNAAFPFNLDLM